MSVPSHFGDEVPRAAAFLEGRLGRPDLGVVLGSGFAPLAGALGAGERVSSSEIPGCPECRVEGHGGGAAAARVASGNVWLFAGRLHLYEGHDAARVAFPVAVLAAAGVRSVLLTCAAGGLDDADVPGDFAVVTDHINLAGADPLRVIPPERRDPPFLDLQEAYDPAFRLAWHEAARAGEVRMRDGVLAALAGPCYETPAEVRMVRGLGADLVSMSTVPEAIAARYLGLRVAAVACVSNKGAGMAGARWIHHGGVVRSVEEAVAGAAGFLRAGIESMAAAGSEGS